MSTEQGITCSCGGRLIEKSVEVEFFGIDFGIKKARVCADCNAEYLDQSVMEEIENEVKRRGLFGLERNAKLAKSGNSLVIRVPKEIVASLKLTKDTPVTIYPPDRKRLIVEIGQR